MIELSDLLPAGQLGWQLMLELTEINDSHWVLIGGQMVYLLALEHGRTLPRATADMDVVMDVRAKPGGVGWMARWLVEQQGFAQDVPSADGLSHRFIRRIGEGEGAIIFDVLAPEGVSETTDLTTIPPGRTVRAPGATQALRRSRLIGVGVRSSSGDLMTGRVNCPSLVGALVLKAAATSEISARINPERDWSDCALLLSMLPDPFAVAAELTKKDRKRLKKLEPLLDREHPGWAGLDDAAYRAGQTAWRLLGL